jgi:hypothetical protein
MFGSTFNTPKSSGFGFIPDHPKQGRAMATARIYSELRNRKIGVEESMLAKDPFNKDGKGFPLSSHFTFQSFLFLDRMYDTEPTVPIRITMSTPS